jgi:hypothetical protein
MSLCILFCAPSRVRAEAHLPLVLNYTAHARCPGADRFLADVAGRMSQQEQRDAESAVTLTVVIEQIAGGDRGTLELESHGVRSLRQVSAADCEQVVSALALMTALALDPNASTAPSTQAAMAPAEPQADESASPAPASPSVVATAKVARAGPRLTHFRFQIGAVFEALAGVMPKVLLMGRPFIELGSVPQASAWSSALRLSAGLGRGSMKKQDAGAEFSLVTGRVELCPARVRAPEPLQLSLCAALDAGRMKVTGKGITPRRSVAPAWVAAGLTARLEWEITRVLVVEIAGELFFPVTRARFFVNSDTTLHRTPAVVGGATAGLGARFP